MYTILSHCRISAIALERILSHMEISFKYKLPVCLFLRMRLRKCKLFWDTNSYRNFIEKLLFLLFHGLKYFGRLNP